MAIAVVFSNSVWDNVVELTKGAQDKGSDPLLWAVQLSSALTSARVALPSVELAHVLVSHICWENNVPMAWKYLEKVVAVNITPPMLVIALLSARIVPSRHSRPGAYRLYLELLRRHCFSFASQICGLNSQKTISAVDEALHLSQVFGVQVSEPGVLVVEFVFAVMWQLVDATLDDEGLLDLIPDVKPRWTIKSQDMEIDNEDNFDDKRSEHREKLRKMNGFITVELIVEFLKHRTTSRLLYLARQNMPAHWGSFVQCLQLLGENSSALRNSSLSPEALMLLSSSYTPKYFDLEPKSRGQQGFCSVIVSGCLASSGDHCYGASRSALWIPLDMFLEDCMDGTQVAASCAIDILTGLIKALQALNRTTWHDAFLAAWLAALRLVQRERDPIEGPVPRLDTRLCILLSVTTLSIADIIEEEEAELVNETEWTSSNQEKEKNLAGKRRKDLISCLQILGDYEGLLTPPHSVISVANQAAAKAMMFVSGYSAGSGYLECNNINEFPIACSGNMRHLIVEACIARNLLDTSAYFWPGYVNGRFNQIPHSMPGQVPGWCALMKGGQLSGAMVNALVTTPASSLAELEKIFEIAINGSGDEKASAATILCGASLIRGWNIQEHTVRFVMKLLSPPVPADHSGTESHLIGCAPVLHILLTGVSSVDCVHIFSLQGLVPELAAVLMTICEAFGSCVPNVIWSLPTGEEITAHAVFSTAFILLLRLWKFNHPPLEHCVSGDGAPVGSQLTPEYLLLLRNSLIVSSNGAKNRRSSWRSSKCSTLKEPIFLDSFPKLKVWYRQHQACIASTLSGLVHGTPLHQIVDGLLNMMFKKMNKGGNNQSVTPGTSSASFSSSSGHSNEDASLRPQLPAWEILEVVPFVVDAALSACSHGRLSPRELATGLKDLADFLPASLATIVSYFSAEVTRGVWKPAFMNGSDWPSPAANLSAVEAHIKKILATTGVNVPSLVAAGSSPASLPLPLAAFVSLTITYKLDRVSERILNLAGPALENLAAGCPWPSMPIVASLWAQKVKRWNDFLIFSASRTVFQQSSDAVVQLLKSCFTATLGLSASPLSSNGGVGGLLGYGFGSQCSGGFSPVAPGFLYLRIHRSIRDILFVTEEILSLLMLSVREIAGNDQMRERADKLKKTRFRTKYGQVSLTAAMTKVKVVAGVGASLLWLSGGSGLVKTLFYETLPSWFLSSHGSEPGSGGMAEVLGGFALAYFAVLCGAFSWGIDLTSTTKRRSWIIGSHMEFLAGALDGKISLGCDWATWRAYVSGFISLMVKCMPAWVMEVEVDVLKRLSRGLRQWNEEELALALLGTGGIGAMGPAAELIMTSTE
ncbi:hypothetical protein H6P81_001931 [Aristolochia fimbriata]|uniref:Reduced epidermal fluorescence 4 n=1 Tax=Aristolochia fimbriata TaxID=158543 RepID=A0AAV7F8Y9_ARIFI|nr:hypothetical protein H6P81_001931 [Aristolochia fimbriata]